MTARRRTTKITTRAEGKKTQNAVELPIYDRLVRAKSIAAPRAPGASNMNTLNEFFTSNGSRPTTGDQFCVIMMLDNAIIATAKTVHEIDVHFRNLRASDESRMAPVLTMLKDDAHRRSDGANCWVLRSLSGTC